jgi:hypothetical protein
MEKSYTSNLGFARPKPDHVELVGLLIRFAGFLASGIGALTISTRFVWEDIIAVLFVAVGASGLVAILAFLLRREPSNVSTLRQRLVSSYAEAIRRSQLAPTSAREPARV